MNHRLAYAAGFAALYALAGVLYIVVSSQLAAASAATIADLQATETWKGIAYVGVTGLATFAGTWVALGRFARDAEELNRRERALIANESRVVAGAMSGTIAHDVNNVLMAVLADLEHLQQRAPSNCADAIEQLRSSVDRLVALNRRLTGHAQSSLPRERIEVDLPRLTRDCVASVRAHSQLRHCRIVCRGDTRLAVATQPALVQQILANLLVNAGEATDGCGSIEVEVATRDGRAVLTVDDNGPGVPRQRWPRLFETMETTKPHGTGLGLFSVRACVTALGGEVEVGQSPLGGASFTVTLPLA